MCGNYGDRHDLQQLYAGGMELWLEKDGILSEEYYIKNLVERKAVILLSKDMAEPEMEKDISE